MERLSLVLDRRRTEHTKRDHSPIRRRSGTHPGKAAKNRAVRRSKSTTGAAETTPCFRKRLPFLGCFPRFPASLSLLSPAGLRCGERPHPAEAHQPCHAAISHSRAGATRAPNLHGTRRDGPSPQPEPGTRGARRPTSGSTSRALGPRRAKLAYNAASGGSPMSPEDIERAFRDLGLADDQIRLPLARLAVLSPKPPVPSVETVTAAHTATEVTTPAHAELERGS